jgi:hypothetical protein
VRFSQYGELKKCLLTLDREVRIRKNCSFAVRDFFKKGRA